MSGKGEVLLLWHPEIDRVELSVRDVATGAGFHLEVVPGSAIDAFYHPYAYAAWRENSVRAVRAVAMSVDGYPGLTAHLRDGTNGKAPG